MLIKEITSWLPLLPPVHASPLYQGAPALTDCCSVRFLSHWWQTCLYGRLALEQKARKKDALPAILGACNRKNPSAEKYSRKTKKQAA